MVAWRACSRHGLDAPLCLVLKKLHYSMTELEGVSKRRLTAAL